VVQFCLPFLSSLHFFCFLFLVSACAVCSGIFSVGAYTRAPISELQARCPIDFLVQLARFFSS